MVFPDGFLWGVSASGFQFEMGDPEGKNVDPNTDWFAWVHDPTNIRRGIVSGDLPERGIDYWGLYRKDHSLAKNLGLNAYRIGVEWSRIFPRATHGVEVGVERATDGRIAEVDVDEKSLQELDSLADRRALDHYRSILQDLRAKGFKVMVCLNHFTLPSWIHDPLTARRTNLRKGPRGWYEERTVVEFVKYAAYLGMKLGDLVDSWATFCEPMVVLEGGYLSPEIGFPPGVRELGFPPRPKRSAFGKASINLALAHSRAYDALKKWDGVKAYDESTSPAEVGVIHNVQPFHPLDPSRENDLNAVEFVSHVHNHFFIQAATTGWLDENLNGIKERGEVKRYLGKRLDWLGINYYTRVVIRGKLPRVAKTIAGLPTLFEVVPGYGVLGGMRRRSMRERLLRRYPTVKTYDKTIEGRPVSDFGWEIYPQGISEAIDLMKGYGKPMYITEHGVADAKDRLRPGLLVSHLRVLEQKMEVEKLDLRGYFHWALTDNYEWARGFAMKFGLFSVDLKTKKRVPRKSARVYKEIVSSGTTEKIERKFKI